jgi:ABC-type Fe3+ transport system substrate-binding protein
VAKAAHAKASELFVRWMMSQEGQIAFNGNHRSSSPLGPLPGTATPPDKSVQRTEPPDAVEKAWNDLKLYRRFQLLFEIVTNDKLEAVRTGSWFSENSLVIASHHS